MSTPRILTLALGLTLSVVPAWAQDADAQPLDYPKEIKLAGHRILIHEPTPSVADGATRLRFPLEAVDPTGRRQLGQAVVGASFHLDLNDRTFLADGFSFETTTLGELVADETTTAAFTEAFPKELALRLELLLARPDAEPVGDWAEAKIAADAPVIHTRRRPAILVQIDGEPELVQVESFPLHHVANTASDLFRDDKDERWLLLVDGSWAEAQELTGPWRWVSGDLPVVMSQLPAASPRVHVRRWVPGTSEYRDAFKGEGSPTPTAAPPEILVEQQPAELVLLRGDPLLTAVRGSKLWQVANTESDLFFHPRQDKYFLLLSGRWYASESVDEGWGPHYGGLPKEFTEIPVDGLRGHVRWSVPGTPEAKEALVRAGLTERFVIGDRDVPKVRHEGEVTTVPSTIEGVERVSSTEDDMFKIDGTYYLCVRGAWFRSNSAKDGWKPCKSLPEAITRLDAASPLFHVRFVTPIEAGEGDFGFAVEGYYGGLFPRRGAVVLGTGRSGNGMLRNGNWYPQPRSFGENRWYDPVLGMFQPRTVDYGDDGLPTAARWSPYTASVGRVGFYPDRYRQGGRRMFRYARDTKSFDASAGRHDPLGPWGSSIKVREGLPRERFPVASRTPELAAPTDTEAAPPRLVIADDGSAWRRTEDGAVETFRDGKWGSAKAPAEAAAWLAAFARIDARPAQLRRWAAARRAALPVNSVVTESE